MSELNNFDGYEENKVFSQNQTSGLDVMDLICDNINLKKTDNQNIFIQIFNETKEFLTGHHNVNGEAEKVSEKNILQNGFEQEIQSHKALLNIVEKLSLNPNYLQDTLNITNNNQLKDIIDKLIANPNYLDEINSLEN